MANLLGQNIGTNYKGILSLDSTINTPLDATLRAVTDGEGNVSPLQLSTDAVSVGAISGARLAVKGTSTTQATNALLVQNSAGLTLLKANDNKDLYLGSSTSNYIHQGIFFQGNYYGSGNWMFGTLSDLGARLGIKGSGTTSATTALLVQNSAGTEILKVTDDSITNARGTLNVLHPTVGTRSLKLGWGSIFATDSGSEFTIGAVFSVSSSPQIMLAGNTRSSGANTMQLQASLGVSIAASLINPNASSILDVSSTTKGFLPPRMTTTQKNAIASPASGLMVYDITTNKLSCYNGTTWNDLF